MLLSPMIQTLNGVNQMQHKTNGNAAKKQDRSLTEGSLMRHLIYLAIPMVFGNILQEFYNTIDAFVVGRYAGEAEFAAIGIAGSVMNLFLFIIVGCCTGFSILFAQAYGQNDMKELRRQHFSGLLAGALVTVILMAVGGLGMNLLLKLLKTPADLQGFVSTYLIFIFLSLPAVLFYNLFASLLRSAGDTKAALYVLAAAVGMNLVLDIIFVALCHQGIKGAAVATAMTQVFSAVAAYIYLRCTHREMLLTREDCRIIGHRVSRSLMFGLTTGLHHCSIYLGKIMVQGVVNTGGTEIIAAYTAATRIEGFANSFGSSGSTATSILTAQNHGAGLEARVRATYKDSLLLLGAMGLASTAFMLISAPQTIGFMLGTHEGLAYTEAIRYFRTVALFYLFCFVGNTFTGHFNGEGRVSLPFIGALGHISFRVIGSYLMFGHLGLTAVALATGIGWLGACIYWLIKIKLEKKQ